MFYSCNKLHIIIKNSQGEFFQSKKRKKQITWKHVTKEEHLRLNYTLHTTNAHTRMKLHCSLQNLQCELTSRALLFGGSEVAVLSVFAFIFRHPFEIA